MDNVKKFDWRSIVNLVEFDGDEINIAANFEINDGYAPMFQIQEEIFNYFYFDKVKKIKMTCFAHKEGKTYYLMRADRPIELDLLKEAHEKFLADK